MGSDGDGGNLNILKKLTGLFGGDSSSPVVELLEVELSLLKELESSDARSPVRRLDKNPVNVVSFSLVAPLPEDEGLPNIVWPVRLLSISRLLSTKEIAVAVAAIASNCARMVA